jgi:hypothetical protein
MTASETRLVHDPVEIARALAVLLPPGGVIECRIPNAGREGTISGYFDDPDALVKAVCARHRDAGVYATLNPCKPELLARHANRLKAYVKETTKDHEILSRRRLLLDFDSVRSRGISANDEQHDLALVRTQAAQELLSGEGWPQGILADSGNGGHAVYGLNLPNDDAAAKLIEKLLKALAQLFDCDKVRLDATVYNASRIVKLWGTVARKGDHIPERPHRLSRILKLPEHLSPVPLELLEKMADTIDPHRSTRPAPDEPREGGRFDLAQFLAQHLNAKEPESYDGGLKWRVICPFNAEHDNAAVFRSAAGKIGFHCFHQSCKDKHWQQVRELFEPPRQSRSSRRVPTPEPEPEPEANEAEPPDGAAMVRQVEETIRKYVVLVEEEYLPVTLWTIATHAAQRFDCFPYLALISAAKRSGKTRLLEVLETMVYRPWRGTAPSPAALYRMLEDGPTLLLDENEALNGKNKSESAQILLAALNAGHRKGATVPRCDGSKHEIKHFRVYGPKAFAAIGRLPDTLLDRSIVIAMKRRKRGQAAARFRQARAAVEGKFIRESAAQFAKAKGGEINQAYQATLDVEMEFLGDRDADLWTPLFTVCIVTAPDRLADLKRSAITLSAAKVGADVDDSYALTLLRDIRSVWPQGEDKCETSVLLENLKALEESPWSEHQITARKLARILKPFGVEPKNVRIGDRIPKGYDYETLRDAFDATWRIYPLHPLQTNKDGPFEHFFIRYITSV